MQWTALYGSTSEVGKLLTSRLTIISADVIKIEHPTRGG